MDPDEYPDLFEDPRPDLAGTSLGERPHGEAHCDRGGQPHLGPCTEPAGRELEDQREARPRRIAAQDVQPGMHIWNPYGGARGFAEVASAARTVGDHVEFDTADGRVAKFRPGFELSLNWTEGQVCNLDRSPEREAG